MAYKITITKTDNTPDKLNQEVFYYGPITYKGVGVHCLQMSGFRLELAAKTTLQRVSKNFREVAVISPLNPVFDTFAEKMMRPVVHLGSMNEVPFSR